jgi:adenosylcobinamide-phosphate synthase
MTFWGALLALLGDQLNPLYRPSQFDRLYAQYAGWIRTRFDAGTQTHALFAWLVTALLPALLVGVAGGMLSGLFYLLGLLWNMVILYQCTGFRQLINLASATQEALLAGDTQRARARLAEIGLDNGADIPDSELVRSAVGHVFTAGLSRVFGVLFWFSLLGPFGAVAYTLTVPLALRWRGETDFCRTIGQIMNVLDWLPTRLLAFSFAIVGNFEEAMMAWRTRSATDEQANIELLTATGFGALGLNEAAPSPDEVSGAATLLKRAALAWVALLGLLWLGGV